MSVSQFLDRDYVQRAMQCSVLMRGRVGVVEGIATGEQPRKQWHCSMLPAVARICNKWQQGEGRETHQDWVA